MALFLFATINTLFAQMNNWIMPPKKFNMTTATPTATTLSSGPYSVANGAYDNAGNLLFYAVGGSIYSSSNTFIDFLPGYNFSSDNSCGARYSFLRSEIAIVPIPGTCKQYYVIYSMANFYVATVLYIKVNCSGATPVITYNGTITTDCTSSPIKKQGFFIGFAGGSYGGGLAVSKVYTGSGSTAKRFLFLVGGGVTKCDISASGISAPSSVVSSAALGLDDYADFDVFETELSWGANKLAWSSNNGMVHVIGLNSTGGYANSIQNYSLAGAKGIEFDNSITTTPKLYVSCTAGVKQILTLTQATSAVATSTFDLTNTYLEYGKNNKIYGISPVYNTDGTVASSSLVGIDVSTNAITSISTGTGSSAVDSRFALGNTGVKVFTMPDQVDGENYNDFNGIPSLTISNFKLNGNLKTGTCSAGGLSNYCQNAAITFVPTYAGGTPSAYKFDIQALSTCALTTATGKINYHGAWTTGVPATNLDLRTLSDAAGKNLSNSTAGYVRVTYSVQDACGNITTYTQDINMYVPIPPVLVLEIYNYATPQIYLSAQTNIASPAIVGASSIGYRINNSTGTITSLTVVVDEVTSTGTLVKNIYNTTTSVNGVSSLTYENLNYYCVSQSLWGANIPLDTCNVTGSDGYFSYTNGLFSYNKYFKLTVTIANQCGSATNYSYLKVNSRGKSLTETTPAIVESGKVASDVAIYPNPATDNLTIEINAAIDDYYTITIIDVLGNQVLSMSSTKVNQGSFKKVFDISTLSSGVYTYHIKSSTVNRTGTIIKN